MNLSALRILLFIFSFLIADVASSQSGTTNVSKINLPGEGSLSGKVTEKGKQSGVPGASVYIPDLKLGVVADSNGRYKFNSIPSGTYLVEVHSVGYKTFTKNIS